MIHKRKLIACPTALVIYSVVISSAASSCIESLFIIDQESIWVGILIIMISLPINVATGIYEAMYFATKRFGGSSIAPLGPHNHPHLMSIDSMNITIEYDTKKNKMSSKFTSASQSKPKSAGHGLWSRKNSDKEKENSKGSDHEKTCTNDDGNDRNAKPNSLTNTTSTISDENMNDHDHDINEQDFSYFNHVNNNMSAPMNSWTVASNYNSVENDKGGRYIINFEKSNANRTVFRGYLMFMMCWVSHSIVQFIMVFIDALFRECYPNEIFLRDIDDGGHDDILCDKNTTYWLLLLWTLIVLCFLIVLSFIGYIRHLWLLYFKDGSKINVHYFLMSGQIDIPGYLYCCKCCYECEMKSALDEYGVLLSSVRSKRLSTNEEKQYKKMKYQLEKI